MPQTMSRQKADWKKKYLLARTQLPETAVEQLQVDEEALFSITPAQDADKLSCCIAALEDVKHLGRLPIITDGCACVGGNVISFACCGALMHVNAVELDSARAQMLANNVSIVKAFVPSMASTTIFECSYLGVMRDLKQDVVFLDPPWRGPSYKKEERVRLFLDNKHLADIVAELFACASNNCTKYVVFKTPKNFDEEDMHLRLSAMQLPLKLLLSTRKMYFYVVHFPAAK